MSKKLICFAMIIITLCGFPGMVLGQIVVENASARWERDLIPAEFPDIPSRIVTEYVTTIYETRNVYPEDLIASASEIPARTIVEYATSIAQFEPSAIPICEGDFEFDADVDGTDLAVFASDFGRTDCSGDCEGDFDEDGDVDGSDLAVFAADFGRTECPLIFKVE